MYWYYKYPLLLLVILLLFGVCVFIWRTCLSPYFGKQAAEEPEPIVESGVPGRTEKAPVKVDAADEPAISGDLQVLLAQSKRELQEERLVNAREMAYTGLEQCEEYSSAWMEFANVINSANKVFMNGSAPCPEKKRYVIVEGDKLVKIAYRLNTTVAALQKLSGLSRTSAIIYAGNPLVYIDGTWSIRVSKKHFLLCLYLNDKFYRFYRISIGRHDRTPEGNFVVNQKQPNPTWTYEGRAIPFGDPENVLGTRWIGLKPVDEINIALRGYGIHGTTEPENIGKPASLGCIRMLNEEVEELYDFIPDSFKDIEIKVVITE